MYNVKLDNEPILISQLLDLLVGYKRMILWWFFFYVSIICFYYMFLLYDSIIWFYDGDDGDDGDERGGDSDKGRWRRVIFIWIWMKWWSIKEGLVGGKIA